MATAVRKTSAQRKPRKRKNFEVFSLHATEPEGENALDKLVAERSHVPAFTRDGKSTIKPEALDSETAAKFILNHALDSKKLPDLVRPRVGDDESDFRSLGTEFVPLTGTKTVKFRQYIKGIPVYGSLITVELDERRECLALNATVATPEIPSHLAKISPLEALRVAAKRAGYGRASPNAVPQLYFFLDHRDKWHLAYMIDNVRVQAPRSQRNGRGKKFVPLVYDYVVNALTGKLLIELPRTPSFAAIADEGKDDRGETRTFKVCRVKGVKRLTDPELNLETYSFGFDDPRAKQSRLPGKDCVGQRRGQPWDPAAVSAHVNAGLVARYLRAVLHRNNIDNKGGRIVSVVNCVVADEAKGPDKKIWKNAFWDGERMVYGQDLYRQEGRKPKLRSMASNPDVVAHELFHGVTSNTARLEYLFETGALNESYSDVFAILISNWKKRDMDTWDWALGDGLTGPDDVKRDFEDPTNADQPRHMTKYKNLRKGDDKGGVHVNSGIHNYAAYNVMMAEDENGGYLFKPHQLAAIFYIALTQYLARQATFKASRRAVVLATRSYFRKLKPAALELRVRAVERGFAAAGIY